MAPRPAQAGRSSSVKRRSDLTFKHNLQNGRHGWLRLTPAYSVKIVDDILGREQGHVNVLDPFSGTGTTALCAAMRGLAAVGLDINPFLVWLGTAKGRRYEAQTISRASQRAEEVVAATRSKDGPRTAPPPISNIHRWWDEGPLAFLCRLKGSIDACCPREGPTRDLLLVAFCRTMIALSNAAFNHQSMSFKRAPRGARQLTLFGDSRQEDMEALFSSDLAFVVAGARDNPCVSTSTLLADSRRVPCMFDGRVDLLITSPPYPNRMSYIRELRPYMYWLGFLREAREAGELDWEAIGGTWGVATSRVACWERNPELYRPPYLDGLLDSIRLSRAKSGDILARYVGKYFEDIWLHLESVLRTLRRGAEVHYVVGNSKFYDVLIPVELVYEDMLKKLGVSRTEIVTLRKRNSKKELFEYDVIAVA